MNAANEEAVGLFLQDKIGFYDIADAVEAALRLPVVQEPSLADIFEADRLRPHPYPGAVFEIKVISCIFSLQFSFLVF